MVGGEEETVTGEEASMEMLRSTGTSSDGLTACFVRFAMQW